MDYLQNQHSARLRLQATFGIVIIALGLAMTSAFGSNPDCALDPTQCGCPQEDPCKCNSGGTGSGSIRFVEAVSGYVDGDRQIASKLNFAHKQPSVTMHTIQGINFLTPAGAYLSEVRGYLPDDETVTLTIVTGDPAGALVFEIPDGQSSGVPVRAAYADRYELVLLDHNRQPAVDQVPAYVELRQDGGDRIVFDYASGDAIEQITPQGRVYDFSAIEVIRESGVLRQVLTSSELIDFLVIDPDFEYELRLYAPGQFGSKDSQTGLYRIHSAAQAYKTINIRNPAYDLQNNDETHITRNWNGRVKQWRFHYYANNDLWEVQVGELVNGVFELVQQEAVSEIYEASGTVRHYVKELRDPAGNLLEETVQTHQELSSSTGLILVAEVRDPDAANLIHRKDYYINGSLSGKLKYEERATGQWSGYEYDASGREVLRVDGWLDSICDHSAPVSAQAATHKATHTSYLPVDPADDASLKPDAPRAETVKLQGVTTAQTWYAYYRDSSGLYHEVRERATTGAAGYGAASNLRAEQIYYATLAHGESTLRAGRLKSELGEDGSLTTYDYTQDGSGAFLVSQTRVHRDAPAGMAYRSTRRVKTYDASANLVHEAWSIFDGKHYQPVYYLTYTYNADRKRTETRRFDGIAGGRITESANYAHGQQIEHTDETGRTVYSLYDILDRKQVTTESGFDAAAGVGDIIRSYHYATAATGCGCTAAEVLIQNRDGSLSMTEINETDRVKRKTRRVDVNGLETTYEYADGGRIIKVTNPNGSTRTTTHYLDGRIKSITGTGVIPRYYSYGVHADGTTWTRIATAGPDSPRYRQTRYDLAGRLRHEAAPAYDGSTLSTEYLYDTYGRLAAQRSLGQAARLYEYDAMGQLSRSGLDVDDNGSLDPASSDRITGTTRSYAYESGAWFEVSTTAVYPNSNSAAAVTVSTSKRRLSGFSDYLTDEHQQLDIHGQTTIERTEIDRANKTVVRTIDVPTSSIDAVSTTINGYLLSQNSATVAAPSVYTYDALGRQASIKDPRHTQASTWDYYTGTRQVFTRTDAAGNTTAFTYYPNGEPGAGQIASVTDAKLQKSYRAYDLLGRQTRTWGETDYPQAYSYSRYGELATLTTWRDTAIDFSTATWPSPINGDVTTWSYQASTGLLTRKEYADGNGTDYAYDRANRLAVRTWARDGGLDTTYSYDANTGELLNVNYEAADTADITYTYDRLGRLKSVTDATGTRSFAYDSSSLQLHTETLDSTFYSSHALDRSTDNLGRSTGYSLKDSASSAIFAVNYTYEPSTGRLATVSDGTDTFTYAYAKNSNFLASLSAPQHTVDYSYEANRDLMTRVDNKLSGSSYAKYAYSYDELGRRIDREQSGSAGTASTDTFAYNSRSEVLGSTNDVVTSAEFAPTYSYDPIGNRLAATGGTLSSASATYQTNALNQYTAISAPSAVNPTYDKDGNQTSNGTWTYSWNNENRLKSASNGSTTIDFLYDYRGRLVKKDDGTTVEVYAYDGWNRIAKFDASNFTLQTSYLWGTDLSGTLQGAGGVGGLLKEGNLYPTYDANGNIMQKLDATGAEQMNVTYDPFGNIISGSLVGEYGFATKPLTDQLDWYYYGFRYYDPVTGRWPNRDPLSGFYRLNYYKIPLYVFVNNRAINTLDLLGLLDFQEPPPSEGNSLTDPSDWNAEEGGSCPDGYIYAGDCNYSCPFDRKVDNGDSITCYYANCTFTGGAFNCPSTPADLPDTSDMGCGESCPGSTSIIDRMCMPERDEDWDWLDDLPPPPSS